MKKYLLRIYDESIKTNYIERVITASDRLDLIDQAINNKDILREKNYKLLSNLPLKQLFNSGFFSIQEL